MKIEIDKYNPYPAENKSDWPFATSIAPVTSLTRLYIVVKATSNFHFVILNIDNGQFLKWKMDKDI